MSLTHWTLEYVLFPQGNNGLCHQSEGARFQSMEQFHIWHIIRPKPVPLYDQDAALGGLQRYSNSRRGGGILLH